MKRDVVRQIEQVAVDKLIPYARNARTHSDEQVAQIAASIKEFGFTNPVLIDGDGGVIAGHGRVLAARKLNLPVVPCLRLDHLTPTQRQAYVLADNKLALNAGWDDAMLAAELADLVAQGYDVDLTGFAADEIAALTPEVVEGLTDDDAVPDAPAEPVTKLGDVWLLGRSRVVCGSSTDAQSWERLGDVSGAVTFTSPPYGAGNVAKLRDHYVPGADSRTSFYNEHQDDVETWPDLMDGWTDLAIASTSCVICNVQMLADNKRALVAWLARLAPHLVDVVIWDKGSGAPQMQANVLTNAFEFVFILSNQSDASRSVPFAKFHGTKQNIVRIDPHGKNEYSDVHRAVMPTALAEWAVDLCDSALVFVDPFGGTGTTLIAAEKRGRSARLIELDPKYVDVAVRRWQDFTGQRATLESTGEEFPA